MGELKFFKSNLEAIDSDLKDINISINKIKEKPWLVPVVSIISVIVGAYIGPYVSHRYDEIYVKKPMLNLLAIEIVANQQAIGVIPNAIGSFLSNIENGKPDNTTSDIEVRDSVFKSYINQMVLLDDDTRTDITVFYQQLYGMNSQCEIFQKISDGYSSSISYITQTSVKEAADQCIAAEQLAYKEADILLAEINVNDDVNIPGFIAEDYLKTIKQEVNDYLDKLQPGATTSLDLVTQADKDDGGFGTAVELLRLGAKINYPISKLEFLK